MTARLTTKSTKHAKNAGAKRSGFAGGATNCLPPESRAEKSRIRTMDNLAAKRLKRRNQIALLAYNLLNWFKRLCVPPRRQRATLAAR